ncbi:MAG: NAD(P)H-binding protein [Thermosynechococcaceae cyanobacterium]
MKVVVTGSLGNISKPLAEELVQKGHAVTVISSKPERRKDIEAMDASAAIGLLEDVGFLTNTFTGADAVYCMEPPNYSTEPDLIAFYRKIGRNYAQAIQQSGVKRIIHLSSFGAHLDKGTGNILGSHYVESILNELSDTNITHMRPTYIYYNLYSFVDMIKKQGVMVANYGGEDKIEMVSPKDIAAAVTEEIETVISGKTVRYVASDERTGNEIASILGTAIGKPDLKWIVITNEQMQKGLEASGMPTPTAANLVEMYASLHGGLLSENYEQHKPIAMGKVKLENFAKEFAAVFQKE